MKTLLLTLSLTFASALSMAQCLKPITPNMPDLDTLQAEEMEHLEVEMARYMRENETYMACVPDDTSYEDAAVLMRELMLQYNDTVRAYHSKNNP
jgi:hypothetical protein